MPSMHADARRRRFRGIPPGPHAVRPLLWPLLTALLAAYGFRTTVPSFRNSDDASNFLAGLDMAAGNWRLHDWVMAVDNYYPTDVLLQALLRLLFGVHPLFMQAAESAIWAGIAVLGIRLALHGSGATPPMARVGILSLALSLLVFNVFEHQFRDVFLTSVASHGFTILLTLLAFTLLTGDEAPGQAARPTWRRMLPLCLVLAVGSFADPVFIVVAGLPVLATSLLELRRHRSAWVPLARIGTTLLAILLAQGLLALSARQGGFETSHGSLDLAGLPDLAAHLGFAAESVARLLGIKIDGSPVRVDAEVGITLLRAPLLLAFLVVCWEVGRDVVGRVRAWPPAGPPAGPPGDGLDRLLWFSLVLDVASTAMTSVIQDLTCARFFMPATVAGSILIARRFGRSPLVALYGVVLLLASIVVAVRAVPPGTPGSTIAIPDVVDLTGILRRNGLRHGYGGYWEGPIVTALSRREVTSLALVGGDDGRLHTFNWFCNLDWYRQAARDWVGPVFVVVTRHPDGIELGQDTVVRTLGPPRRTIPAGRFLVDVYDVRHGELDRLQP